MASRTWVDDQAPRLEWWRRDSVVAATPTESGVAAGERPGESRLPFWALMAFTVILLLSPQQTVLPDLAPLRPALVTAGLAVISLLYHRFIRREPLTIASGEMWIATCLMAWSIITVPVSRWPGGSLAFLFDTYLKSLVIFWLLANAVTSLQRIRRLVTLLSVLAVPLAIVAVWNFLSGEFVPGAPAERRIVGYDAPLTHNPNDLALMLNLLVPLGIGLLLSRPRPLFRALLACGLVLDVLAIILTFSRAGFLTLVVIALAYLWKLRRGRERGWVMIAFVVAVACLPLLPAGYTARLATITDANSDPTGSSQERRQAMLAAVSWVARHPVVGSGIGQNMLALNIERGPAWRVVHNVYLQHAVELGLPGIILFLMLLGAVLRSTARVEQEAAGDPAAEEVWRLAGALRVSLIAFSFAALFHPVAYQFYFYYMAGLALALKTIWDRSRPRPMALAAPATTQRPR
jgi:O-antigen ligase